MKGTYDKVAFTKSKKELTKVINCGLLYRMTGIRWPVQGTRVLLQTERGIFPCHHKYKYS